MNKDRLDVLKKCLSLGRYTADTDKGIVYKSMNIAGHINSKGYWVVDFSLNNKKYRFKIHEIIAVVGELDILDKTVHHKDENKDHNYLSNLESLSHTDNVLRSCIGVNNSQSKLNQEQVDYIKNKELGYGEIVELMKQFNISRKTIYNIRHNVTHTMR